MSYRFDPRQGLVIVEVDVVGPSSSGTLRLALDTGATGTLINTALLVTLGYDPATSSDRTQITTGSGIEFVPRIAVNAIRALGQEQHDFPVLCHTLPSGTGVDGLLGLDFLRGYLLMVDFHEGTIRLA